MTVKHKDPKHYCPDGTPHNELIEHGIGHCRNCLFTRDYNELQARYLTEIYIKAQRGARRRHEQ